MDRKSIERALEQTVGFLEKDGPVLVAPRDRAEFLERTEMLLEKARHPGEVLYVGILGGTGVGKSTLINALAHETISSASDRRPFTDKAVVYRHADTPRGLDEIAELVREPDAVHQSDKVKNLVLLDLPDFDSYNEDHRRTANAILPWLDCVVWVASPEKYADDAFYRLIGETVINRDNFTFVLNKADELKIDGDPDPHSRFKEVLGDFIFRLKHEGGMEDPRIFILSADYQFQGTKEDPVLEREFSRFRDFLMARRNAKEIASVKTANLVGETLVLLKDIHAHVRPEEKIKLLDSIREIDDERVGDEAPPELRLMEGEQRLASLVYGLLRNADSSIGPVRLAMRLLGSSLSVDTKSSDNRLEEVFLEIAETLGRDRSREMEKFCARVDSELIRALGSRDPEEAEDAPKEVIATAFRLAATAFVENVEIQRKSMAGVSGRLMRLFQRLVLLAPVPVFIIKLAGLKRLDVWIHDPTVSGAFHLIIAFLTSLFGADGLTGLAVLLICQFLLTWYLAARRLKRLRKRSLRLARSAVRYIDDGLRWAEEAVRKARQDNVERIGQGVNRFLGLQQAVYSTVPEIRGGKLESGPESE